MRAISQTISGAQRLANIRTKARMVAQRTFREEGYHPCTGDLEREFIEAELDALAGRQ